MAETRKPWKLNKTNHQMDIHSEKMPDSKPSWSLSAFFSRKPHYPEEEAGKNKKKKKVVKFGCSVSLCNLKDSSMIMHKAQISCTEHQKKMVCIGKHNDRSHVINRSLKEIDVSLSSSFSSSSYSASSLTATSITASFSSSTGGSVRGRQHRSLSGCYECHSVLNPMNGVSPNQSRRLSTFPCLDCEKVFMRFISLELHQAVCHAVSELGPEDTSRNIVEIIFQSSWLKKQAPPCKIDRILKINNTKKTIANFEDYRDYIKTRSGRLTKKYPRCAADGNELLRFVCINFTCSIGLNGSTNICHSIPRCSICSIIRDGFKVDNFGRISTMATSKGAHDSVRISPNNQGRAMLVCRVIAGRVKKDQDADEECDSFSGPAGTCSSLDELSKVTELEEGKPSLPVFCCCLLALSWHKRWLRSVDSSVQTRQNQNWAKRRSLSSEVVL